MRPLALSADAKWLYAVNTPDARLEIFRTKHGGLEHAGSVQVGLEPVAVPPGTTKPVALTTLLEEAAPIVSVDPVQRRGDFFKRIGANAPVTFPRAEEGAGEIVHRAPALGLLAKDPVDVSP